MCVSLLTFLSDSCHISRPTVFIFTFHDFQFSHHILGPTVCISHFPLFSVFLAIIQVKQCLCLIFHIFQFSLCYLGPKVFFSFFKFASVSHRISHPTVCVSHFPWYSWYFSRYIPGPRECISHSLTFSLFLAIFQVKQCLCLIFHVFQFSHHIPVPTLWISHFPPFSVFLAIFQVEQCLFLIFLHF